MSNPPDDTMRDSHKPYEPLGQTTPNVTSEEKEKILAATKTLGPALLDYTQKLKMRKAEAITRKSSRPNPLTKTSIELRQEAVELIPKDDARAEVTEADLDGLVSKVQARLIHLSTEELKIVMSKINTPEHVLSRAVVYNMLLQVLIAISVKENFKEDEPMLRSESILVTEWESCLTEAMKDKKNFWCDENVWLLREIEEDDDLMSNIMSVNGSFAVFDDHRVRHTIDSLEWVGRMVKSYLENHIIDTILSILQLLHLDPMDRNNKEQIDLNFLKAKVMLVKKLLDRSCKAGARLLWMIIRRRHENTVGNPPNVAGTQPNVAGNQQLFRLVTEVFLEHQHMVDIFLVGGDKYADKGEKVSEMIRNQDIFMGKVFEDHLLCWATRRDYCDLIYCIMQYERVSKTHLNYDAAQDESVILSWKYAVWTAARFENWQALQYLLAWNDLDVHGYGHDRGLEEWLPPLHMVALMGDWKKLKLLFHNIKNLQANTRDHRGRMPLDLAMQGKDPDQTVRVLMVISQDVVKHLDELYNMYINHANAVLIGASIIASVAFVGWLQPPLGYVQDYVAIEGHKSIEAFVIFNCLAFFLAIATMLVGAEATLFVHDKNDKHVIIKGMRSSLKWMIGFFLTSIVCFMGAYISAGIAVLPPVPWSMVVSIIVGGGTCLIPIIWIFWHCTKRSLSYYIASSKPNIALSKRYIGLSREKDHPHQLGNSGRYDSPSLPRPADSNQENHPSPQRRLDRNSTFQDEPPKSLVLPDYSKKLSLKHDRLWLELKYRKPSEKVEQDRPAYYGNDTCNQSN